MSNLLKNIQSALKAVSEIERPDLCDGEAA